MFGNTTLRVTMALALVASLAACNSLQRGAEKAVRENLKDPDSAKFGSFYYNAKLKRACFTVNARNSMGGYTGDQQVALLRSDKEGWAWISSTTQSQEACRSIWADNASIPV